MINPSSNKTSDLARWLKQVGLVALPIIVASSRGLAACCEWLFTRFEEVKLENTSFA